MNNIETFDFDTFDPCGSDYIKNIQFTPRSLEACESCGILLNRLFKRDVESFDGPTSLKIRRAQDYESRRVALLAEVRESRREIIKKENRHKELVVRWMTS